MLDPAQRAAHSPQARQQQVLEMASALCQGQTTPAQLNRLSSAQLAEAYERGYHAWEMNDWDQACTDFAWLVMQHPFNRHYHLALAATLLAAGQAEQALPFSHYAWLLKQDEPDALAQIATGLTQVGEIEGARAAWQDVLLLCHAQREADHHAELAEQAQSALQQLHY